MANEPVVANAQPVDEIVAAPKGDEFGAPGEGLDQLSRELPARGGLAAAPLRESRGDDRDNQPAHEQAETEHETCRRQERRSNGNRDPAGKQRDERRPDPAKVEVLERIDVRDEPRQQVSTPVALELRGRERLDPVIDPAANACEIPEGEVMRAEAFEVACDRPRDPEEAHADDRSRERENRRLLRRSRDQISGGGHQADPEDDRCRPQRDRKGDP
jgi:hypothetical protein